MITYGSVCSGIEAATVAWHTLGFVPSWFSEIEPFPRALLKYRYPQVPNLGDMTRIAAWVRAGIVSAPDVLVGGTPCQAFSIAGVRAGLLDPRGQLTLAYADLLNAIDEKRPGNECVAVWENVPGVLSDKTNAFGCFLAILAGEDVELVAPGGKWPNAGCVVGPQRTIAWRILDAQYFGVAQRRRRVFVVASARDGFDPAAVLFELDGVRRDTAPSRETREDLAGTVTSSLGRRGGQPDCGSTPGYLQPVAFGGNNQTGPIDVATARNACASASGRLEIETETFLVQPIVATLDASYGRLPLASGQDANHGHSHLVPVSVALRGRDGGAAAELGDELAFTLRASGGGGDKPHVLAPIAFDSRQECVSSPHVFGALGSSSPQAQAVTYAIQAGALRTNPNSGPDGVGVQSHIAYTLEARAEVQAVCVTGSVTRCLKAEGFDASEDGTGRGQPIVAFQTHGSNIEVGDISGTIGTNCDRASGTSPMAQYGHAVRRLTPRECERLQGFPDNHTAIPFGRYIRPEKLERDWAKYIMRGGNLTLEQVCALAADGPRYKALGNSMAVPCMRWIGFRLMLNLLLTRPSLLAHTVQNQGN